MDEGIKIEMFVEAKVFRLGEFSKNLHKRVMELESKMTPNTHLEVLEERRKATTEVVQKIEEAKALCTKMIEHIS